MEMNTRMDPSLTQNTQKKKEFAKTRPPVSAGSRKTKGNAVRESSGSDHPPQSSGKSKNVQRQDEEEDNGGASDVSAPTRLHYHK